MSASMENPYAGQGSVLLDIGGDIGALVVTTPAEMEGVEIEIRPVGAAPDADPAAAAGAHPHSHDHDNSHDHSHDHAGSPWPHVAVVTRPTPSGPVPSLVFGEVREGRYELYIRPHGPVRLTVDVTGGAVTEAEWPTGSS